MQYVIVGGGVAGMTAALDLASRDVGTIALYTDEAHPYYYRPMLTEFFCGKVGMARLVRRDLDWYAGRGIDVHLETRVTALHPAAKTIALEDGTEVPYDKLLLAVGSLPFVPPIAGKEKAGIYTWRTLADTLELQETATACGKTLVLGGGLLGLEAARGLSKFCANVTVLEYFPRLLPRQLDTVGAGLLQRFVENLGIEVVLGAETVAFLGEQHVTGARLKDGREFPAGLVLVAAGVRSDVSLAQAAGLAVDRGVVVDAHMATSAPDIYAAGDVAVYQGQSWAIAPIAQAQARIAAANMAGESQRYDVVVPSTTLKVVGIEVSSVGVVNPDGADYVEVAALDEDAGIHKKIVLHEGLIVGAIVINAKPLAKQLEQHISERHAMTQDAAQALVDG